MSKKLERKHILLDTNVLSNIFYRPNEFIKFLQLLESNQCILCLNDFIHLEFLRIAKSQSEASLIEKFLKDGFFIILPSEPDILVNAKEIYPLYNFCSSIKNHKQVSVVDVLNTAYLKKYKNSLLLVTLDNNDYPLEILNRFETGTIDIRSAILTWGIYEFDVQGFSELKRRYNSK